MTTTGVPRIRSVSVFAPGDLIDGRYRIVERIARGGMATVFEAEDTRLDRHVALKVMHPALAADETYVTRFGREARASARLSHPNIVAVHDQGEDDGRLFLVMELVRGRTLRQVLDEDGALSPRATLDIAAPLADALAAAHAAGLIHRDIKPENVIIREDGVVKVTDFGLARAVTSETATSATDTLLGTVSYLSPEQVEQGRADARSDIYAAGLVIFEMLTGTKAFTGDNPMYVAYQHVHAGVPAPSSRADGVPDALDSLVEITTSRDPMERPVDGNALAHLIRSTRARLSVEELDDKPRTTAQTRPYTHDRTQVIARRLDADEARPSGETPVAPLVVRPSGAVVPPEELPEGVPTGRRRRGGRVFAALIAALLLAGGAAAGWYFLAGPGSPTVVPPIGAVTFEEAVADLEAADLAAVRVDSYDETIPVGHVVSILPIAGAELPRGSEVTVRVSQGQERYAVPTLVDTPAEDAAAALEKSRLILGERSDAFSETVPAGTIISTSPEAGEPLKRGDAVDIVVSQGRQPIAVPSVAGQSVEDASASIESQELTVAVADARHHDSVPTGHVIAQDPADGTLYRGDTVTITPSLGPELVTVPNVIGNQIQEATRTLEALGLKVEVERIAGGFFGSVRYQSEAGGTQVRKGSTITLSIV